MFKWLKKIVDSKISITINIVSNKPASEPVAEKHWPSALVMPAPVEIESTVSSLPLTANSYRFVNDYKKDLNGKEEEYWYTEVYDKGTWKFVSDSLKHKKDEAMTMHLKLIAGKTIQPEKRKTVLWENMPEDKVRTWVAISTSENK